MDVFRMLLMKCCNEWCVVLNHYGLGCMSRVGWNPSWFPDYRDYGSLSTGIWSLRWLFLYLCSYDLVGSITPWTYQRRWSSLYLRKTSTSSEDKQPFLHPKRGRKPILKALSHRLCCHRRSWRTSTMAMKMDDRLKSFLSLKLKAVLGGRRCVEWAQLMAN